MKNCFNILLIFACFAWSSEPISVEIKDEQPNNSNMLGLRMRIINNSGQQYNDVQIRYYLKKQPTDNLVLENYYMSGLSANLEELDNTTTILNIGVPTLSQGSIPNADGISIGIHRSDWGEMFKGNLPGYPSSTFTEAASYGVYQGNNLIAGNLSPAESPDNILKLRFIGVRPETADTSSTWVQLQNYGDEPISLNSVKIKDASGGIHPLGDLTIGAKSSLRVCNGPVSNCTSDSVVTSISGLSFGKVGEFVLYQDSVPLDYIAWGAHGNFADSLQVENRTIDPEQFFNTSEEPVLGPVSPYYKGDFFRAIIKADNDSIISWDKFREKMVELPLNQWPFAEPFAFGDSSSFYKRNGEETVLAWIPAAKARSYEVTVLNANDKSLVLHEYTDKLSSSISLEEGEYLWIVQPKDFNVAEFEQGHTNENPNIPYNYYKKFKVFVLADNHKPLYDLEIEPLAARKDSYMLDLKWGERIIDAEWDKPHNTSGYVDLFGNRRFTDPMHYDRDAEESWRCWAVATAELNHYYYGNLTQDEIKFFYNNFRNENGTLVLFSNPILDAFPHDDKGNGLVDNLLPWALNMDDSDMDWYYQWNLLDLLRQGINEVDKVFVHALKHKHPIVIWGNNHFMVVDAVILIEGTYIYRFHNMDNNGSITWKNLNISDIYLALMVKKRRSKLNKARMSLLYEDMNGNNIMEKDIDKIYDADGDGLLDFDEYYRFGTYHYNSSYDTNNDGKLDYEEYRQFAAEKQEYNKDYDNDGIEDKTEIMSYTIREKYPEKTSQGKDYGVRKEVFADIDSDGLRAEKDPDSDGDGIGDGDEDVNHNGKKDNNETDVYVKDNNQTIPPNAANVTLYARSELNYNDGVVCYNENMPTGFCSIASAAEDINGAFATKVGARATVGNIYSKGKVLLRSNTRVKGGIYLAAPSNVDDIYMQNGSTIDNGITNLPEEYWNINFLQPNYDLADYTILPNYGYELNVPNEWNIHLNSGYYTSVKVEAGGTLTIPPGTYYIGSIQLDPRSNVKFSEPGYETIMHINGDFTWRAKLENDAAEYTTIAQGFKLIQHAHGKRMYIDNMVAGSIVAPHSEVILAQSWKLYYGKIYAEKISVHQYAKLYHVDFNPIPTSLAFSMGKL